MTYKKRYIVTSKFDVDIHIYIVNIKKVIASLDLITCKLDDVKK